MRIVILILLLFLVNQSFSQSSFYFYDKEVKPGTKQHFKIPITDNATTSFIPITVFCGIQDGPTLGITAGVHGYEYPPILAGQKLIQSINPKSLKGVVILVQIANLGSFKGRSPFVNPLDGKNLNRVFPGNSNGTITDRIANFITTNVITKSDYFLDAHAGDASEDLMPYSAYYSNSSLKKESDRGKEMAKSLLFDHIIIFNTDGKKYMNKNDLSLYCSAEAFKRGIPSVDIECGKLGTAPNKLVAKIESGILNMLRFLGMNITSAETKIKDEYLFVKDRTYQISKSDGIFYPSKKSGDYVKKGMKIGIITDYFGQVKETIFAKSNGIILLIVGTPPVNKGETILTIGKI
ncbi:Succinylglutamate desuccinylase [Tenacibaculum sp. 190524A05c]|uniref:succinylglutamate desuccinylase/aspartoacylase family protein n=1 Tax=Tenacibaculum platacis TaxID=3137852 RepID=UPI0031FB185D